MEIVVSQELHHIPFLKEHFQVLEGGLGSRIPVKGRHIVVHRQNDFLSLAALSGPERIGISRVDALLFQLILPLFFELFAVLYLIAL